MAPEIPTVECHRCGKDLLVTERVWFRDGKVFCSEFCCDMATDELRARNG